MNDWPDASDNSKRSYDVGVEALRERLEKSKVEIGPHVLYCESAEFIVPTLIRFDALVTDPPYGIGYDAQAHKNSGTIVGAGKFRRARRVYEDHNWDNKPISFEVIRKSIVKSKWQIIFGGNYYDLRPSSCWLVWDKKINGHFADCELAWTNLEKPVRRIEFMWNGMLRAHGEDRGDHPTQKPIGVMKWCIEQLPEDTVTILDPFMGSGTTGVAAAVLGKRFTGVERERKYFDIACRRIEEATKQADLFIEPPKREKPVQEVLL